MNEWMGGGEVQSRDSIFAILESLAQYSDYRLHGTFGGSRATVQQVGLVQVLVNTYSFTITPIHSIPALNT